MRQKCLFPTMKYVLLRFVLKSVMCKRGPINGEKIIIY